MKLKDITPEVVVTTSPEETIIRAGQRMRDANIGCLVVTAGQDIRGIITDRELVVRCVSEGHRASECRVSVHDLIFGIGLPHRADIARLAVPLCPAPTAHRRNRRILACPL